MEITIDFRQLEFLLGMNVLELFWYLFSHGGWLILLLIFAVSLYNNWLSNKQSQFLDSAKKVLLAIDIPRDNEQSMKAVEQIFATLSGIKTNPNLVQKYLKGFIQQYFSLEIVSIEGYIQFLIRTPEHFRDLAEAAIYSQYPEAEITEVEDYVNLIPPDVHEIDSDYHLWGTEFYLEKHSAYPIKIYKYFEHTLSQSFVDPMASLLEVLSKIGRGEQIALQLIITPSKEDWKDKGYKIVNDIVGAKTEVKEHLGDKFVKTAMKGLEAFSESVINLWSEVEEKRTEKDEPRNYMINMTPDERFVIEAIQNKLAQTCFGVRFRMYYLTHKDVFSRGRGVNAVIGAINQFNSHNLNSFKKNKKTTTDIDYFFINYRRALRQKKLVKNFKDRKFYMGAANPKSPKLFMLSIEELATIFHFPTITVKAPSVKYAEAKKGEPPTALPIEIQEEEGLYKMEPEKAIEQAQLPAEEFTIEESLPGYDFDNDYYEKRFAKKNHAIKPKQITEEISVEKKSEPPSNLPIA